MTFEIQINPREGEKKDGHVESGIRPCLHAGVFRRASLFHKRVSMLPDKFFAAFDKNDVPRIRNSSIYDSHKNPN